MLAKIDMSHDDSRLSFQLTEVFGFDKAERLRVALRLSVACILTVQILANDKKN